VQKPSLTPLKNFIFSTALHGAVFFGHVEMVRMLVRRGARLDGRQNWGGNAVDVAKLLVELGTMAQKIGSPESKNAFYTRINVENAVKISEFLQYGKILTDEVFVNPMLGSYASPTSKGASRRASPMSPPTS